MSKLNSKATIFFMSYAPFKLLIVVYIIMKSEMMRKSLSVHQFIPEVITVLQTIENTLCEFSIVMN